MIKFDFFFKSHLDKFPFLTPNELMIVIPLIKFKSLKKRSLIVKQGQINTHLFWVQDGLFRLYYEENGKEVTFEFGKKSAYLGSLDCLINNKVSTYSIESVTDSKIYFIDYIEFSKKKKTNTNLLNFELEIYKNELYKKMQRTIFKSKSNSIEDLYINLTNEYKDLYHLIPSKQLASYLGITEVSFCRLKKRLLKTKV